MGNSVAGFRLWLAGLAPLGFPLLVAGGAGAGIAQPGEAPVAPVPVFPDDLEALAGGLLHADLRRRHRLARQLRLRGALRLFRADQANPFVTHTLLTGFR